MIDRTVQLSLENILDIKEELEPLVSDHWDEVVPFSDNVPLDVDWEAYGKLQREGYLFVLTARETSVLVGYVIGTVTPDLHRRGRQVVGIDSFYTKPSHRKLKVATNMLSEVERMAGSCSINVRVPPEASGLLEGLGYTVAEVVGYKLSEV